MVLYAVEAGHDGHSCGHVVIFYRLIYLSSGQLPRHVAFQVHLNVGVLVEVLRQVVLRHFKGDGGSRRRTCLSGGVPMLASRAQAGELRDDAASERVHALDYEPPCFGVLGRVKPRLKIRVELVLELARRYRLGDDKAVTAPGSAGIEAERIHVRVAVLLAHIVHRGDGRSAGKREGAEFKRRYQC
ncbi:hypothetical protein SDC9_120619 [bioreactor metagenome]|uniref:Uncharacterized protein n=1 Tax=bioreactor metagenome TaxID=1076179 RepID=A0A645C888_9ZZZZ